MELFARCDREPERLRVVPLGQALEMDTVWDGRDLIAALSRIIG